MQKTVLITGATSGIGQACAELFSAQGYRLIITGRRKERLEELKKNLTAESAEVLALNFDVRDYTEVQQQLGELPQEWRNIDVLVNNAGLASGMSQIQNGSVDDWDKMIDTNVKGLLYVTRTIAPLMIASKKGHIINIASIAGKEVYPNGNVYCASKFAVDALSKSMRIDMLEHGIKVTNIAPGAVETEFSIVRYHGDKSKADQVYKGFKPLTGHDIAEVVLWAASQPEHVNINDIVVTPTAQAGPRDIIKKS